jgi:ribosomal protein S27E
MAPLTCVDCGNQVDPTKSGSFREVTGWEKIRMHGGANQIVLRRETVRLMCNGCGEVRKINARRGISPQQETLI